MQLSAKMKGSARPFIDLSVHKIHLTTFLSFVVCLILYPEKCSMQEYPPQVFASEPQSQNTVPEGSIKIISCQASSNPRASYMWLKNEINITDFTENYSLRIQSITRNDAGKYRCVASNTLGAIRSEGADIVIAYIDNFAPQSNQNIDVRSGDGVVINLPSINCVPDPSVTWSVSGVAMSDEAQSHQITFKK